MMDDLALGLTGEQTEKIHQFQDLTGIEDVSICQDVLTRHSWDLEVAVQDQLNIREGHPSVYAASESHAPLVVQDYMAQQVFFSPSSGSSPRSFLGLISYLFTLFFSIGFNLFTTSYRLFLPDPRRAVTDPLGDVMSFIHSYEDNYGSSHPVFYQGTYTQALNDAKQELKFLLVFLHSDDNVDSQIFCRNILSDGDVVQYVNTHMLFWACSVSSSEGYRVVQSLRAGTYPFLALIVLRDSRMTVVARLEGPLTAQQLLQFLETVVLNNEASLVAARAERMERRLNQTLRLQQDEAYEVSLRADREKERVRKLERERREEEDRQRKEVELQEMRQKEEIKQQKIELASLVPEEPNTEHPGAVHVVIKLPNGKRLERRFLQSHSLHELFLFVFCHPDAPDRFEIATNFPKRVLDCRDNTRETLSDVGLRRGEVLFVYDLEA